MSKPIITLSSDFGVQSQGCGIMEAVALEINPDAHVIHLMHGLPDFNISYAARTLETLNYMPVGFHVMVVDPGVGTKRKPVIIQTGRGDQLIGPDNGVLLPATRFLGGIKMIVEITNEKFMRKPVSPIFHGRDIFAPAAAYLSKGIKIEEFGKELQENELVKAPYDEAIAVNGEIEAKIISINKFGSAHLNITHAVWDKLSVKLKDSITVNFNNKGLAMPYCLTFGDVKKGKELILKDDYGRIELAVNQGSLKERHGFKIGDKITIKNDQAGTAP
jgi:S-adenosyl-L-methionine hydrolase (adenosine-forming)